ncbi:MAG: hypothetical protein FJZ11_02040 [Candidatus Omnitrophica bacterium]|nr:hypothetical protein [Candidatus Omnitrophota bacterium]
MKNIFAKFVFIGLFLMLFIPITSAEVSQSLLYPDYSKRIFLDFQDASLKDVLKVFSQQSELNFIASDEIKDRTITLFLQDVPVEEALELLLTANKLTYEIQEGSNIFIVKEIPKSQQTITKIFFLKYASVSNSKIKSEIDAGLVRGGEFGAGAGAGGGGGATTGTAGIKGILENVLSDAGKVVEDPRTNSLIVTDLPSQFPIIEQTIAKLDIPTPQVLIEVEMLDVSKDFVDNLGIKWQADGEAMIDYEGPSRKTRVPLQEMGDLTKSSFTMGTLSLTGLDVTLNLLSTDTDTKYLARPRILTLSNETAEIKIVTDEAIGIVTNTTGESGDTAEEAERAETGVVLRVTPQVNIESGEITMFVEPTVSEAKTGAVLGTTTYKDPETRTTKSILRIKDGETIVVGGLIRTRSTEVITKVPILGDIPFLGALFRHKNKSKDEDRELMVFITPHILKGRGSAKASKPLAYLPPAREQESPEPKNLLISRETEIDRILSEFEKKQR